MKVTITNEVVYSVKMEENSLYKITTTESLYDVKNSYDTSYKVDSANIPFVFVKPINQ